MISKEKEYFEIINKIYLKVIEEENLGETANYIPELSKIDGKKFGVSLLFTDQLQFGFGDCEEKFSIQSISKVLLLALVYREIGEKIWERVDVEPSGTPFNSLLQLETDKGIPRNPFINSGALVVCDILIDICDDPKAYFLNFIKKVSGNYSIQYSDKIAKSEFSTAYRNTALTNFIKSLGNIHNSPEDVLDLYVYICSIEMSCMELSKTFSFLANKGKNLFDDYQVLNISQTKRINAIMQTCGFYDESGEFAFRVGLPGKSGVGGGIVAIMPKYYIVSVWSPKLNLKGNSYRGMKFLEEFTTATEDSIF
ncbi:glutaminase [Empedobacter falsenii]|uniref:glutaminase n=1 Tax=Empedobacter falsenii TaxID=343874 RepID=UPI003A806AFB